MKLKNLFILTILFLLSCERYDSTKSASYYQNMDLNFIILEKKPLNHGREVNFKIKNIKNNKNEIYCEENTLLAWRYKDFEIGDTLVKKEDEDIFAIHKKDTIMYFSFEYK